MRWAQIHRKTAETDIWVRLALDGSGSLEGATGVGFFDHMLTLWCYHAGFDLEMCCTGDLHVDPHHTVEDLGIVLGQAFREALGDKRGIARYGYAYVPMDEALARAVVDLSGRFYFRCEASFSDRRAGELPVELVPHFFYSFADAGRMNLHLALLYGENTHHQVEALFKAAARALRMAVALDPRQSEVPSTKGLL
ncbi:MAG: imidazoleglycerol-phosphate dehydratase HisB [Bacteroidota bacterium]|nr:imidazoleglycerol-phosphate dehydratase HisB [Rhodothermia bacterium]MDW8284654.1 imidazoleglycerol-phosphate dehydratase HisB [Bacteroidota bacterium]